MLLRNSEADDIPIVKFPVVVEDVLPVCSDLTTGAKGNASSSDCLPLFDLLLCFDVHEPDFDVDSRIKNLDLKVPLILEFMS